MFFLSMKGENMRREETKVVQIGNCKIGGGNPIAIQSMTNTKTEDVEATVAQILALEAAGCDIIRCAVPTMEAAEALTEIKKRIHIPLVADIHFDYRLAIAAIEHGADKIRINPGNIGDVSRGPRNWAEELPLAETSASVRGICFREYRARRSDWIV